MQRYFGRVFKNQVILDEDDVFHLTRVMRCKVGQQIEVVDEANVYLADIISAKPLVIVVNKKIRENNELPNEITLVTALIKGDKLDFVLQKATELGVSEIVLLETKRTVVKIKKEDRLNKIARFNKILKEAAEQSKRTRIPALYRVLDVKRLKQVDADIKIIAYEGMEGPSTSFTKMVNKIKPGKKVSVVIGPEGGFTEGEIEIAEKFGYTKVSLGKRILRAETASIYALSVIANKLESK